eukprot:4528947-Pleurochrysis_carterae.AAC.1
MERVGAGATGRRNQRQEPSEKLAILEKELLAQSPSRRSSKARVASRFKLSHRPDVPRKSSLRTLNANVSLDALDDVRRCALVFFWSFLPTCLSFCHLVVVLLHGTESKTLDCSKWRTNERQRNAFTRAQVMELFPELRDTLRKHAIMRDKRRQEASRVLSLWKFKKTLPEVRAQHKLLPFVAA